MSVTVLCFPCTHKRKPHPPNRSAAAVASPSQHRPDSLTFGVVHCSRGEHGALPLPASSRGEGWGEGLFAIGRCAWRAPLTRRAKARRPLPASGERWSKPREHGSALPLRLRLPLACAPLRLGELLGGEPARHRVAAADRGIAVARVGG